MTDEIELARRAVACDGWRWMHRMVDTEGMTYLGVYDTVHLFAGCERESWRDTLDGTLPDLTDPATLGCVLALVREAWGNQHIYCASSPNIHGQRWYRVIMDGDIIGSGRTERAALVEALEAAPVGGAS